MTDADRHQAREYAEDVANNRDDPDSGFGFSDLVNAYLAGVGDERERCAQRIEQLGGLGMASEVLADRVRAGPPVLRPRDHRGRSTERPIPVA
jgi:hypothetical protein